MEEIGTLTHDWVVYIAALAVSFGVSLYMTPVARRLAKKWGAIAYPKSRGMHSEPIPAMGGIAIVCGFFASMLLLFFFVEDLRSKQILGFFAGASIIVVLGILDDIYELKASIKFAVQIIAALLVIATGTRFRIMMWPFSLIPGAFDAPLSLIWIVGLTNAVNFIDGLDGLAAGVCSIGSICLMVLCVLSGSELAVIFTATLAGSCLGFLPRNFSPAEIIMGDTGSTFLGFVLAVCSLIGVFKSYALLSVVVGLLVLALPVFDTTWAIVRRVASGRSPMSADRGHLHHKLIDAGYSTKAAVMILYAISAASGIMAIIISTKDLRAILVVAVSLVLFGLMFYIYRKRIH